MLRGRLAVRLHIMELPDIIALINRDEREIKW